MINRGGVSTETSEAIFDEDILIELMDKMERSSPQHLITFNRKVAKVLISHGWKYEKSEENGLLVLEDYLTPRRHSE